MPNYIRPKIEGASWFFTVNLLDRSSRLLTEKIPSLRAATRKTMASFPFTIDAIVILPDHIHAVWTLPPGDSDISVRWRLIKSHFSKSVADVEAVSPSRRGRLERGIWQRRFWEHAIRDEADFWRHVEYCYINPVKHGHVKRVADWPYSSFHRDVGAGLFSSDWVGDSDDESGFG